MFNYILHHLFWIQHLISLHLHMTHLTITKTTMHSSVCRLKLSFVCMPQHHRVSVPVKQRKCKCKWSYVKPDQRPATVAGAAQDNYFDEESEDNDSDEEGDIDEDMMDID